MPNSQDIWFSERDSTGNWSKAVHLGRPLNTSEYNAVFWISPDNNRILIRNAYIDGDYFGDGVSMCYLTKYGNRVVASGQPGGAAAVGEVEAAPGLRVSPGAGMVQVRQTSFPVA